MQKFAQYQLYNLLFSIRFVSFSFVVIILKLDNELKMFSQHFDQNSIRIQSDVQLLPLLCQHQNRRFLCVIVLENMDGVLMWPGRMPWRWHDFRILHKSIGFCVIK